MRTISLASLLALFLSGTIAPASAMDARLPEGVPTAYASLSGQARARPMPNVKAAVRAGYRPLSELTGGAYPSFTPGIGSVYVRRESLPNGPFVAYDHKGRLASTIYKFSLDRMAEKGTLDAGGALMPPVDHVSGHFSGSHPGVDFPHYSFVYWHVTKRQEARVAK